MSLVFVNEYDTRGKLRNWNDGRYTPVRDISTMICPTVNRPVFALYAVNSTINALVFRLIQSPAFSCATRASAATLSSGMVTTRPPSGY